METKLEELEVAVEEPPQPVEVHDALESEKELKEWIRKVLELMLSGM